MVGGDHRDPETQSRSQAATAALACVAVRVSDVQSPGSGNQSKFVLQQ
jgi:hypothetical protein